MRAGRQSQTQSLSAEPNAAAVERLAPHIRRRPKGPETRQLLKDALSRDQVCAQLSEADIDALLKVVKYFEFRPGEAVEEEGDASGFFFVVHGGTLEVRSGDRVVDTLRGGSAFGGESLLSRRPRTAAVVASAGAGGVGAGLWGASGATIQKLLRERAQARSAETRRFLEGVALFEGLPARQMELLSGAFVDEVVEAGTRVVEKGATTTAMYFVRAGALRVVDPASWRGGAPLELAQLGPGDCFGERALLYGEPRVATVVAGSRCELLRIDAAPLQKALGTDLTAYLERCLALMGLRGSPTYSQLTGAQQSALAKALDMKDLQPGAAVAVAAVGPSAIRAIVVVGGELSSGDSDGAVVSRGQCHDIFAHSTTSASSDPELQAGPRGARVGILRQEGLARALGPSACGWPDQGQEVAMDYAQKMLVVKKVPVLRHLSKKQTEEVVAALKPERYSRGARVIVQGQPGNSFFVIAHGEVTVTIDGRLIRTQGRNACFGERALLFDERRTATVEVSSDTAELWTIDKETFRNIVHGNLSQDLMYRIGLQDTQVTLADLRSVRIIGTGASSVVRLVEHRRTKVRYALKTVKTEDGRLPPAMANECSILAENDHPFVLYVVKTFHTPNHLCMLTELITGGDLHGAIRAIPNALTRKQAQFYTGSLLIAVEALWDRNIVYRDLKPENVMLDAQGYLKIIDFGVSKKLGERESRTFTMVGTPHYMAPEVMRGRGYGLEVDLWSLGVMLFEFVCGGLPFANDEEEPSVVCAAVLKDQLLFPSWYRDSDGRNLIEGLLLRDPRKRLGAGPNGCADVRGHPYFRIADGGGLPAHEALFDRIMGRELDPPLLPRGETYCDAEEEAAAASFSDEAELWPAAAPEAPDLAKGRGGKSPAEEYPGMPGVAVAAQKGAAAFAEGVHEEAPEVKRCGWGCVPVWGRGGRARGGA